MTVPEAIQIAKRQLITVMPEMAQASLELQELEVPPAGSNWRFTFAGTFGLSNAGTSLAELMRGRRVAKTVEIDASDGTLVAVRNATA